MQTITFSSAQLPAHLSSQKKFDLWCELFSANVGPMDYGRSEAPFEACFEFNQFGSVGLSRMRGSIVRAAHGKARPSSRTKDHFGLLISAIEDPVRYRYRNRETFLPAGGAVLVSSIEAEDFASNGDYSTWTLIDLPKSAVLAATPKAEDLVGMPLRTDCETLRMIRGYVDLSLQARAGDPRLHTHIGQTFTDLIGIALGAGQEATEVASQRGMKAALLESILKAIADGYSNPEFAVAGVAKKLRVSERYVQDVLHGTGKSFSERVMELRLQHAAGLLSRAADRDRKVSDIALSSGFNDLSYFHRCYRRRFGMTPAGARVH